MHKNVNFKGLDESMYSNKIAGMAVIAELSSKCVRCSLKIRIL
jgi:hypothetical protein